MTFEGFVNLGVDFVPSWGFAIPHRVPSVSMPQTRRQCQSWRLSREATAFRRRANTQLCNNNDLERDCSTWRALWLWLVVHRWLNTGGKLLWGRYFHQHQKRCGTAECIGLDGWGSDPERRKVELGHCPVWKLCYSPNLSTRLLFMINCYSSWKGGSSAHLKESSIGE